MSLRVPRSRNEVREDARAACEEKIEKERRGEGSRYRDVVCSEHLLVLGSAGILSLHLQANETAIRESRIEML